MKTASVRDVQHNFRKILSWVESGEEVVVTRRNRAIARLVQCDPNPPEPPPLPDFPARARAIWGSHPKGRSLSADIIADREERF
jgi:antitoxin (DNA-binding transcriptional repressor) of toxin-antitoxin stability system